MTFTTQRLTGSRVIVRGTDTNGASGECVLDSTQWDSVAAHDKQHQAQEDFDAAVEEFFRPITEAAERASQTVATVDEDSFVVLHEGVEGVRGRPADILRLNHDSIVLRIIEQGNHDRLVWVNEKLEVLEVLPKTSTPSATSVVSDVLGAEEINVAATGQATLDEPTA